MALLPHSLWPRPPVVLIHGAANSALVWTYWQEELAARGWAAHAIDLRGHGKSKRSDLSRTSMEDYVDDVCSLSTQIASPPVLIGWSMGGLVAMMAAQRANAAAVVALAPSLPARTTDRSVELRSGEFGAEEYGITTLDPAVEQPAMPDLDAEERTIAFASLGSESRYARDERRAGIVIDFLPCPLLIATGSADTQWPRERYDGLWLPADYVGIDDASHWGLVLNRRALAKLVPAVVDWVELTVEV